MQPGPGPASYQRYRDYDQLGESFLYTQQPRVRIRPLIGPKVKREQHSAPEKEILTNEKFMKTIRPFWTTIGTRTFNSRLPNAPISTIHHRFGMLVEISEDRHLANESLALFQ